MQLTLGIFGTVKPALFTNERVYQICIKAIRTYQAQQFLARGIWR